MPDPDRISPAFARPAHVGVTYLSAMPAKILIVEDEIIVARDISHQLIDLGYLVAGTCTAGEEAIDLMKRLAPDLVLMDIQLAGAMDGITAAEIIREKYGVPVVFLSAFAGVQTEPLGAATGWFDFIGKPFFEHELHAVVEMALTRHRVGLNHPAIE